jgi:hypothetical protein
LVGDDMVSWNGYTIATPPREIWKGCVRAVSESQDPILGSKITECRVSGALIQRGVRKIWILKPWDVISEHLIGLLYFENFSHFYIVIGKRTQNFINAPPSKSCRFIDVSLILVSIDCLVHRDLHTAVRNKCIQWSM